MINKIVIIIAVTTTKKNFVNNNSDFFRSKCRTNIHKRFVMLLKLLYRIYCNFLCISFLVRKYSISLSKEQMFYFSPDFVIIESITRVKKNHSQLVMLNRRSHPLTAIKSRSHPLSIHNMP